MGVIRIFDLERDIEYKDEKIEISYRRGEVSNSLSAYLFDENGKKHHVYWNIDRDRCHQSFDKTNKKVKDFIMSKVQEWLGEQREVEERRRRAKESRKQSYKEKIKSLMDNF